ncbi:Uncharacterised protein [Vibrio cholerae]|nr:Uncharacterised protein [Vibrio cholerae]
MEIKIFILATHQIGFKVTIRITHGFEHHGSEDRFKLTSRCG